MPADFVLSPTEAYEVEPAREIEPRRPWVDPNPDRTGRRSRAERARNRTTDERNVGDGVVTLFAVGETLGIPEPEESRTMSTRGTSTQRARGSNVRDVVAHLL